MTTEFELASDNATETPAANPALFHWRYRDVGRISGLLTWNEILALAQHGIVTSQHLLVLEESNITFPADAFEQLRPQLGAVAVVRPGGDGTITCRGCERTLPLKRYRASTTHPGKFTASCSGCVERHRQERDRAREQLALSLRQMMLLAESVRGKPQRLVGSELNQSFLDPERTTSPFAGLPSLVDAASDDADSIDLALDTPAPALIVPPIARDPRAATTSIARPRMQAVAEPSENAPAEAAMVDASARVSVGPSPEQLAAVPYLLPVGAPDPERIPTPSFEARAGGTPWLKVVLISGGILLVIGAAAAFLMAR